MSTTAPVILGMLRLGLRTGYEIKSFMDRSTRFFWSVSYGQIYPELKRLEERGLIRGEAAAGDARGRTNYELTSAGEGALREWLGSRDGELYALRDERVLKLFFADAASDEEALEIVRSIREYHEGVLAHLREIEPLAAKRGRGEFPYRVLRYGLGLHGWVVDWCKQTEKELSHVPSAR